MFVSPKKFFLALDATIEKQKTNPQLWAFLLKKGTFPVLQNLVEYIESISGSNAFLERIFSTMKESWWDKRNRLTPETVKAELLIYYNLKIETTDFQKYVTKNQKLLDAARSDAKYTFKYNKN